MSSKTKSEQPVIVEEVVEKTTAVVVGEVVEVVDGATPVVIEAEPSPAPVVEPVAEPAEPKKALVIGGGAVINRRTIEMLREEVGRVASSDRAEAWSRDQMIAFLDQGIQPEKTLRGNWPHDERRGRGTGHWVAGELLDWMEGIISTPGQLSDDQVWDEIYLRYKIKGNWSREVAEAFILKGVVPETTPSGLLINDRYRDIKPINQWVYKELRAAIRGEITAPHPRDKLLSELRKRLGLSEAYGEKLLLKTLETDQMESSMSNSILTAKLNEYRTTMSKGGRNLTEDTAGAAQTMFYKTVRQVMGRDYVEFHEGWVMLLDFINEHYTQLFTPGMARRGWGRLSLAPAARATFEDLMTLMIHTRAPINRAGEAKLYNLDQILRHVAQEKERQNVLTFYTAQ